MTRLKSVRRAAVLVFAAACATALAACGSGGGNGGLTKPTAGPAVAVKSGGTMTYGIGEDFAGFNILSLNDAEYVLQEALDQVWPQVYYPDASLKLKLDTDYVTSAKVTSTNPQTVQYQINPKAVWNDGVPLNADDFTYNWQAQSGDPKFKDVGGKAYTPATTAGYSQIKSVTGSNGGKTVTVVFAKPFGDWQSLFSPMIPAHTAKKVGFNDGFQTYGPSVQVSAGPFQISSYTQGQSLVETPNPKWWGTKAKLNKLVFKLFSDDTQMPPALQNGEVDLAEPVQASQQYKASVSVVPDTTTSVIGGLQFQHIDFNQSNPYLAKLPVRQAIIAGTNRNEIVQRLVKPVNPTAKPLNNRIYVPNQPQFQDTGATAGAFDVAKAKSLLASAGMKMGPNGYYQPTFGPQKGKDLTLSISTTSGKPVRQQIEQLFQADMKAIGIKLNIQNYAADQLFGTILPKGQFQIAEFAWVATPFASSNQSIYCSFSNAGLCGQNYDHYADPAVDNLLNQATTTIDPAQAATLYNQVDAQIWKDAATLPLYQEAFVDTWYKKWGNIQPNPTNWGPPWNANQWGLKAAS